MTRTKNIKCLDGSVRKCERLLSDDGWGYLTLQDGHGTVLVSIPDSRLDGNSEQARAITETRAGDDLFGTVIYAYTRTDATADGALIDVTRTAREAGFTVPVAVTHNVWADCVAWDDHIESTKPQATGQDEAGRLWDVLQMARFGIRQAGSRDRVEFPVHRVPATGSGTNPRRVTLAIVIGPGDLGEPVITIMQPGED